MPEMDGFEVCKILKNDVETENIPIIFMTARTDDESIENAFKAGAVDYIVKPIRKSETTARVKTHLKLAKIIEKLEKQHVGSSNPRVNEILIKANEPEVKSGKSSLFLDVFVSFLNVLEFFFGCFLNFFP